MRKRIIAKTLGGSWRWIRKRLTLNMRKQNFVVCTLPCRGKEASGKTMMIHVFTSAMQTAKLNMLLAELFAHENFGDDTHFARDCPAAYTNRSNLSNPAVGEGTPTEVTARLRKWQQRLCQRHENLGARRNN